MKYQMIQDKISKYKETITEEKKSSNKIVLEDGVKMIGWFDMTMRFSSKRNKLLFGIASLGTCSFGLVRPGFAYFFGKSTNGVAVASTETGFKMLGDFAFKMMCVGLLGGVT